MNVLSATVLEIGVPQLFGTWENTSNGDCFCFRDGYISDRQWTFRVSEKPLIVRIGKNARVTVVEQHPYVNYFLDKNSTLFHLCAPRSYRADFNLAAEANLRHISVGIITENLKNTFFISLNGENASVEWSDGMRVKPNVEHVWTMLIEHHAPQTHSDCRVHSVIEDNGGLRLTYDGYVHKFAADSVLLQKNLIYILTPNGRVCARPMLHIANKNVRASHGTATQPLPIEELFYLQSRGLPIEIATQVFLDGFLGSLLPNDSAD
jgi:Fe-S cluster assembly scaffold protein SufB